MSDNVDLRSQVEGILATKRAGDEINVEKIQRLLKLYDRNEIVWLLKGLAEEGRGRFVVGRRGQPSRFIVGSMPTQLPAATLTPTRSGSGSGSGSGMEAVSAHLQHVYVLRASPPISITLPLDITSAEADRIVRWVKTLPVDDLV